MHNLQAVQMSQTIHSVANESCYLLDGHKSPPCHRHLDQVTRRETTAKEEH